MEVEAYGPGSGQLLEEDVRRHSAADALQDRVTVVSGPGVLHAAVKVGVLRQVAVYRMGRHRSSDPRQHDVMVVLDCCNTYARDDIFADTSLPYMIGALLCEHLLHIEGKEGLFRVVDAGADPWPALAQRGITPAGLTDPLRAELKKPAVSVPIDFAKSPPPEGSVAREYFDDPTTIYPKSQSKQHMWKSDWFNLNWDEQDQDTQFYEYCIITQKYQTALSVIWEEPTRRRR